MGYRSEKVHVSVELSTTVSYEQNGETITLTGAFSGETENAGYNYLDTSREVAHANYCGADTTYISTAILGQPTYTGIRSFPVFKWSDWQPNTSPVLEIGGIANNLGLPIGSYVVATSNSNVPELEDNGIISVLEGDVLQVVGNATNKSWTLAGNIHDTTTNFLGPVGTGYRFSRLRENLFGLRATIVPSSQSGDLLILNFDENSGTPLYPQIFLGYYPTSYMTGMYDRILANEINNNDSSRSFKVFTEDSGGAKTVFDCEVKATSSTNWTGTLHGETTNGIVYTSDSTYSYTITLL